MRPCASLSRVAWWRMAWALMRLRITEKSRRSLTDYGEVAAKPDGHVAHLLGQVVRVRYGDAMLRAFEPHLQGVPARPVRLFGAPIREGPEHPPRLLSRVGDGQGQVAGLVLGVQLVAGGRRDEARGAFLGDPPRSQAL